MTVNLDFPGTIVVNITGRGRSLRVDAITGMTSSQAQTIADEAAASAASSQTSADAADAAVTLAQQAQAAALEVPDANVSALIDNPVTATADALRQGFANSRAMNVKADLYGMSPANTGAQNLSALQAAIADSAGKPVYIPTGVYDLDAPPEFTTALRLVGDGARVDPGERWAQGDSQWASAGPAGTVLRCSSTLAAGQPFIYIGNYGATAGSSLRGIALVGTGAGVGLRCGAYPGTGSPVRWSFSETVIANFDVGMQHTGENGVLTAPYIVGCGDGFAPGYPFNGNTIIGLNVERCNVSAVRLDHAIGNVYIGGVLQANTPSDATIYVANSSLQNRFVGLYCENYAPSTGLHAGELYEVWVGAPGSGGPCYGIEFEAMHWGSTSPVSKVVSHNAYFTTFHSTHAASGTTQPSVVLSGGGSHTVVGLFPSVTGAGVDRSRVLNFDVQGVAVDTLGWGLVTRQHLGVGSFTTLPDAVGVGRGALVRDATYGVLSDSGRGDGWAPVVARLSGTTSGAGSVDAPASFKGRTHIKMTNATSFKLWPLAGISVGRSWHIRNVSGSGMTVSPQPGDLLDGGSSGMVLAAGDARYFVAEDSGWVSY